MPAYDYNLRISRLPDEDISLKRVNVFLGTNGTGKSKLLQEIRDNAHFFDNKPVIYIEGGRTIKIIDSLQLDGNTYGAFSNTSSENAKTNHKNKHTASLADRVRDALLLIDKLGQDVEINHSRAVVEWQKDDERGPSPIRETPPIDRLFQLFYEIFPSITLEYDQSSKVLKCFKNGSEYSPSRMSDGEKQVFSLLADIVVLGEDGRLVIADEPELNLNPGLADKLWDLIEEELTDSVFIYGTHSVGFAMRANVEKIYVLSNSNLNIAEIKNVKDIDEKELPALLGSIPAILASNRALAIEGRENSIDSIIYRWLLDKQDIEVVAVGGCDDVRSVANKTGVWEALAPSVQISGVIDRDFKPNDQLGLPEGAKVTVLSYHEIESYLCHPKIVNKLASAIGTVENIPTEAEVETKILNYFTKDLIQIAARRVFARGTIRLSLSIEKKLLSTITDTATLESTLVAAANDETAKALKALGEEKIKEITKEELEACEKALANRSIDDILALMPGKLLLNELAPLSGCKNALAMARAASKHLKVADYEMLTQLKNKINAQAALNEEMNPPEPDEVLVAAAE